MHRLSPHASRTLHKPHHSNCLTCAPSQLCVTPLHGQAIGTWAGARGCGRCCSRQALPWHFHRGPQQVNLLAVDVLHVILRPYGDTLEQAPLPWQPCLPHCPLIPRTFLVLHEEECLVSKGRTLKPPDLKLGSHLGFHGAQRGARAGEIQGPKAKCRSSGALSEGGLGDQALDQDGV